MNKSIIIDLDGKKLKVVISRKNNKNMYLRLKEDLSIYITCNYLTSDKSIIKFIEKNKESVFKMIEVQKKKNDKNNYFIYLSNKYEIVECSIFKSVHFEDGKVYVKSTGALDKFLRCEAKRIFEERLIFNYQKMNINKPMPLLVIKKMKAKWGYYNRDKNIICLNLNLIGYSIDDIDYVIVHELSHMVHFNHSKDFWALVSKYKSDYKKNRKNLKE